MEKNKREKRNVPLPHTRRLKSLKRPGESKEKSTKKDEIQLESVLGITISNSASLSSSKAGKFYLNGIGVRLCKQFKFYKALVDMLSLVMSSSNLLGSV